MCPSKVSELGPVAAYSFPFSVTGSHSLRDLSTSAVPPPEVSVSLFFPLSSDLGSGTMSQISKDLHLAPSEPTCLVTWVQPHP